MPLDDLFDPDPEPKSQADYIRALWRRQGEHNKLVVEEVIPRLDRTNGRVTRLERIALLSAGAALALGVSMLGPLIVPLLAAIR